MKKIRAAVLMIVAGLTVSPVLAASKKVSVIAETTVRKLPPAKQRPLEIGSRHEAYLGGYSLIGTLLLKGENRDAVLDLAAKRGGVLALVYYQASLVGVNKKHLSRYEPLGYGKVRMQWTSSVEKVPGFYVELFAPGANYEEGARRFCDCLYPPEYEKDCISICGTIEDMERYIGLGVDPNAFVEQLRMGIVFRALHLGYFPNAAHL